MLRGERRFIFIQIQGAEVGTVVQKQLLLLQGLVPAGSREPTRRSARSPVKGPGPWAAKPKNTARPRNGGHLPALLQGL